MGQESKYSVGLWEMVLYFEIGLSYHIWLAYEIHYSYWRHQFTFKVDLSNANAKKVRISWFSGQDEAQDVHPFIS